MKDLCDYYNKYLLIRLASLGNKKKKCDFSFLFHSFALPLQNDILFFRYWQHEMGCHEIG